MKFFRTQKIERLLAEVEAAVYRESVTIRHWKAIERDIPGAEAVDFDDSPWRDFALGDAWGGYDVVAWFRARVPIPESWEAPPRSGAARQRKLALRFLVGPREEGNSTAETLLYVNGEPLQAIDRWHEEAWLPPETCASGELSLALRAWSGVLQVPPVRHFRRAELVLIDERAERLAHVTRAILQAVHELGENDLRRGVMLEALHQVYLGINFNLPRNDRFYESIAAADRALSAQVEMWRAGRELKPHISAIGHAHIDLAWLWRLRHSREKAVRTFTTALHLMRQYPEYRFMHSAPQAYKFLKEDNPLIFERVRQRIADGRWELTGGMWVEADTNLIGSESLVRQFLYGQRFARAEFGVDMSVLWLPDAFGYSYALPQIALQSGMRAFVTSKLSWSQFNRFPYDTFIWRGVDGSDLLSHFITTPELENPAGSGHTYNGQITPRELWGIWNNYRQGDINDELLMLFGWGDGGGGPTREMLDRAETLRNLPGIPSVTLGKAEPYFDRLAERMRATDLPVWDDELYLEIHRGTYTSQAFLKRANRKAEILYHDAEWLAALSDALTGERAYPAAALREGWESILLHQFHDILPGSSIHEVYDDAREAYRRIEQIGCDALEAAQARIAATAPSEGESLLVFNSLSWDRSDVAIVPWAEGRAPLTVLRADGSSAPAQVVCEDETPLLLVEVEGVPSLGCRAYPLVPAPQQDALTVTPERLENDFWRIELNRVGQIRSLYDKRARREVLARQSERDAGRANILQAFEDKPMNFDAWDIDIYYQEKVAEITGLAEAVVEETGPVRGALRLVWRYGDSTITQRLTIYRASPRIDFRTEVDWWEQQVLLKVAFPVAVRATRATYEIQFGSIERPTHWNTSWDYARFEVVGHKWADLSEGAYGVSLLNDCKYGHDIKGNTLRLTLIKSAVAPDAGADKGRHEFTYSLLPHSGDWREGGTMREAYQLNYPLAARLIGPQNTPSIKPDPGHPERSASQRDAPDAKEAAASFASVDADHVIIETVKQAEDEDSRGRAWIVRVYDWQQRRSEGVRLRCLRPVVRAVACDLIERVETPVKVDRGEVIFDIKPFEVRTFKVWLSESTAATAESNRPAENQV